jgi:hypothetical protein
MDRAGNGFSEEPLGPIMPQTLGPCSKSRLEPASLQGLKKPRQRRYGLVSWGGRTDIGSTTFGCRTSVDRLDPYRLLLLDGKLRKFPLQSASARTKKGGCIAASPSITFNEMAIYL